MTADTASRGRPGRYRRRWARWGWCAFAAVAGLWLLGLSVFAQTLPQAADGVRRPTEAIVVLTGGRARLDTALRLLAAERAEQLFVSGVYPRVDLQTLLAGRAVDASQVACCVTLDHRAQNTADNARETQRWLAGRGYRTIRLVTSAYHMPRARLEFRMAAPGVDVVSHPVDPPQLDLQGWWRHRETRRLLAKEYSKYLVALARYGVYRLAHGVTPDAAS